MKITLELYGKKVFYLIKSRRLYSGRIKKGFSCLLVCAGYSPEVMVTKDGGHYECKYIAV